MVYMNYGFGAVGRRDRRVGGFISETGRVILRAERAAVLPK